MTQYYIKNGDTYEEAQAFSQEHLEELINKRLERERAKYTDYASLKERADGFDAAEADLKSRLAEAERTNSELQGKLAAAELNTERVKILQEFKLNSDLEEFVTGSSIEEMRERAEKLARNSAPGAPVVTKEEKPLAQKSDAERLRDNLFGRNE